MGLPLLPGSFQKAMDLRSGGNQFAHETNAIRNGEQGRWLAVASSRWDLPWTSGSKSALTFSGPTVRIPYNRGAANFARRIFPQQNTKSDAVRKDEAMAGAGKLESAQELIRQGRLEESLPLLAQAVQETPESSDAHYALGFVLARRGNWQEAGTEFRTALQLNPQNANAAYYLGEESERRGDAQTARQFYERAVSIMPTHGAALKKLREQGAGAQPAAAHAATPQKPVHEYGQKAHAEPVQPAHMPASGSAQQPAARPAGTDAPAQDGHSSAFFRMLMEDNQPTAREAVAQLKKLEMNVRARMAPHMLPVVFLSLLIVGMTWMFVSRMPVGRPIEKPVTATAEEIYHTSNPGAYEIENIERTNESRQYVYEQQLENQAKLRRSAYFEYLGLAVLVCVLLLLIEAWRVTLTRFTIADCRILTAQGIIRHRDTLEMYRIVNVSVNETLLTKLTGDGYLKITYEMAGKQGSVQMLGLAKYDKLIWIQDNLREVVVLLRSLPWGRGIYY